MDGTWPDLGASGGGDGFGGFDAVPTDTGRSRKSKKRGKGSSSGREGHSPEFGGESAHRTGGGSSRFGTAGGHQEQPIEHLEALIEAEKHLVQALRLDTDDLNDELHRLEEMCRLEERDATRERSECDRIGQERKHLDQQLEASKRQLGELKLEHEGLHLESIMLRRDRGHYGGTTSFLQKLFDEGTRDVQALQRSVEYFEQSNQSLASHTQSLEEARQEILEQVKAEKDLLRREEAEAVSAKQALTTLRGTGKSALASFGGPAASSGPDALGFGSSGFGDPLPMEGQGGGGSDPFGSAFGGSMTMSRGQDLDGLGAFQGTSNSFRGSAGGFPGGSGGVFPGTTYNPPARSNVVLREGV